MLASLGDAHPPRVSKLGDLGYMATDYKVRDGLKVRDQGGREGAGAVRAQEGRRQAGCSAGSWPCRQPP